MAAIASVWISRVRAHLLLALIMGLDVARDWALGVAEEDVRRLQRHRWRSR